MKRLRIGSFVLVLVLFLTSFAQGSGLNSYWLRMENGFPNPVEVYGYQYEYRSPELTISARIPQLSGFVDQGWQEEFNQNLREHLGVFVAEMQEMAKGINEEGMESGAIPYEAIVDYEVKLNQGGLLSIAILSYSYTGGAHGMTYLEYLNVDLTTGQTIAFEDLFNSQSELERAANVITAMIVEEPDLYFIDEFGPDLFNINQGFYLQDNRAVICFGLYELAPYVAGIREFPVPAR